MSYPPQGTGVNIADADAIEGDVKSPKTFYAGSPPKKTGTMPTQTLDPASENVPAGYYAATTLSAIDPDLATENIKAGKTIFGKAGKTEVVDTTTASPAAAGDIKSGKEAFVNGPKVTGTMPTKAIVAANDLYEAGYHAGNPGGLAVIEPDLAPANIKGGVNIFGKVGTYVPAIIVTEALAAQRITNTEDAWTTKRTVAIPANAQKVEAWVSANSNNASYLGYGRVLYNGVEKCSCSNALPYHQVAQWAGDGLGVAANLDIQAKIQTYGYYYAVGSGAWYVTI